MSMKTIGVLTSGGDAPGMNAAIRSVVRTALGLGMRVYGIRHGYNGLIENDMSDMHLRSVSDIIHRGGTTLYTARCERFKDEDGMQEAIAVCRKRGIEGIVVIGGDGSYRGAKDLSERGIPCVGVPGTIDNDITCSDYTIGFDTALNTACEMVDRLRDTAQSHERCTVVEVMGRHAGYLALQTGLAVGATAVLVAEMPFDIDKVIKKMKNSKRSKKTHFIIVVSEEIRNVEAIATEIQNKTGIESRATVLGHVQRGGTPSVRDRVVATEMGYHAVRLLNEGMGNRVVAMKDNRIVDYDIFEGLSQEKAFDKELYEIANTVSI